MGQFSSTPQSSSRRASVRRGSSIDSANAHDNSHNNTAATTATTMPAPAPVLLLERAGDPPPAPVMAVEAPQTEPPAGVRNAESSSDAVEAVASAMPEPATAAGPASAAPATSASPRKGAELEKRPSLASLLFTRRSSRAESSEEEEPPSLLPVTLSPMKGSNGTKKLVSPQPSPTKSDITDPFDFDAPSLLMSPTHLRGSGSSDASNTSKRASSQLSPTKSKDPFDFDAPSLMSPAHQQSHLQGSSGVEQPVTSQLSPSKSADPFDFDAPSLMSLTHLRSPKKEAKKHQPLPTKSDRADPFDFDAPSLMSPTHLRSSASAVRAVHVDADEETKDDPFSPCLSSASSSSSLGFGVDDVPAPTTTSSARPSIDSIPPKPPVAPTFSKFRPSFSGSGIGPNLGRRTRSGNLSSSSSSESSDNEQDEIVECDEVNDWLDEPEPIIPSPKKETPRDRTSSGRLLTSNSSSSMTSQTPKLGAVGSRSTSSSAHSIQTLAHWLSSPDEPDEDLEEEYEPTLTPFMRENMPVYEVMKQVQLFRNLSQTQQEQVLRALKPAKFQDGEIIVQQGHRGSRFYMIAKGSAVITKKVADDEPERMITHLHAGHYFGELALIYDDPRTATVRAVGDVELLYLTQEDFQRIGQVHLSLMLQQVPLLSRLSARDQDIVLSRLKPANFSDGEYIVRQGEEGTRFYMITRGEAVVTERDLRPDATDVSEKELTRLYEGHVFGEMSLIYSEPRTASVRAVGPVKCLYLSKEDFDKCLLSEHFQRFIREAYVEKATRRAMRLRLQQRASSQRSDKSLDGRPGAPPTPVTARNGPLPPPAPSSPVKATETKTLIKQRLANGQKVVNKYVIQGDLGKGTFGRVKLCRCEDDGKLYAVKIMHKTFVQRMAGKEDQLQDALRREVAIMKKLNHRNVVKLVEVIDDPSSEKMYLVQEYVQHNLMDEVKKANGLSEHVARKYVRDLLCGLHYLHFHKVIHRDIKPENILVSAEGVAKIADFGTARMIMNESETLSGAKGTPAFMAPEMFDIDAKYTGPAVDVWSLGATLYMMVIGHPPWLAENEIVLSDKVQRDELSFPPDFERTMEPHLKNLLQRMLTKAPNLRITLNECFNHDWVTKEGSEPLILTAQENDMTVSADESEHAIQNIPERIDQSLYEFLDKAHSLIKTRQLGREGVLRTGSGHSLNGTPIAGEVVRTPTSSISSSPSRGSTEEASRVITAWRHHKRIQIMYGHKELSERSRELLLEQKRMAFSVDRAKVTEIILPAGPSARMRFPSSSAVQLNAQLPAATTALAGSPERHQSSPDVLGLRTSPFDSSGQELPKKKSMSRMMDESGGRGLEGFGRTSFTSITRLSEGQFSTSTAEESGNRPSLSPSDLSIGSRDTDMSDADLMKRSLSRKKDFLMVTSEVFRDEDGDYQSRKILFQARDHDFSVASRVPTQPQLSKSGRDLGRLSSSQLGRGSRKSLGSSSFNCSSVGSLSSNTSNAKSAAEGEEFNMDGIDCVQVDDGDVDVDGEGGPGSRDSNASDESEDSDGSVYSDVEGDVDVDDTFNDLIGTPSHLQLVAEDEDIAPMDLRSASTSSLAVDSRKNVQVYVSSKIRENLVLGIRSGYADAKGGRSYMEDRTIGISDCPLASYSPRVAEAFESVGFFGVYDGHNGDATACRLQKELHHRLLAHPKLLTKPMESIEDACEAFDRELLEGQNQMAEPRRNRTDEDQSHNETEDEHAQMLQPISFSGSAAVFAIITKRRDGGDAPALEIDGTTSVDGDGETKCDETVEKVKNSSCVHVANVGDCRAVLGTVDGVALEITKDHKASDPDEKARVEKAGGFVHNGRLDGILAISRGFGDLAHKHGGHLIVQPDVYEHFVTADDEFLLLASDGLFDVLSSQQAVNFVHRKLRTHGDVQLAAQELVLKAQEYYAHDNISVIIVAFNQEAS